MRSTIRTLGVLLTAGIAIAGCGTHPALPISTQDLAAAKAFKLYGVYWAGPSVGGAKVTGADNLDSYTSAGGFTVYYGDCERAAPLSSNGCTLPLRVTTILHQFLLASPLDALTQTSLRGVPAVVYDEGRAVELYTDFQVVDVVADTPLRAREAVAQLEPFNRSVTADFPAFPPPYFVPFGPTGPTGVTGASGASGASGATGASAGDVSHAPPAALEPAPNGTQ